MSNVRDQLKAYLDGELTAQQMRQIEQELERDSDLRKEFDEMRRISSTLREASVAPLPSGLEQTLAALQARPAPVKRPWMRLLPAAALVGTCAVAFMLITRTPTRYMGDMAEEGPFPAGKQESPVTAQSTSAPESSNRELAEKAIKVGDADDTIPVPVNGVFGRAGSRERNVMGDLYAPEERAKESAPYSKGRSIVRTADLSLKVGDSGVAKGKAETVAASLGGFVESSSMSNPDKQSKTASLVLRVPEPKLGEALSQLRKLGSVVSESTSGEDITAQLVDQDARLKVMRTEERSYLQILEKAKRVDDVLSVRDRLNSLRQEIESMDAQAKALRNQAAMATIRVEMTQRPVAKAIQGAQANWFDKTLISAASNMRLAGQKVVQAAIYLLVFAPLWIPVAVFLRWLSTRYRFAA